MEIFPALEQAFDYASRRAALLLLTKYQTPESIRLAGVTRIASWLRARGARYTTQVATRAVEAAQQQYTTVAGEEHLAAMIAELADDALRLSERTEQIDVRIAETVERNEQARLLTSMPGFGSLLAAEFVAASGGNVLLLGKADRLAGVCDLAPVSKDSGTISGNRHRPRRYDRRMLRACYISAQTAAWVFPQSSAYYQRKRGEGKSHVQAVLCLARRRINVIFAMLRDNRAFQTGHDADSQRSDRRTTGTPDSGFSDAPACQSSRPTDRRGADLVGVGG
ncbi:transposase [Corynebacterium neomassiliense]|uniref:transposase n=1 Tax=Corynebacterium neomassiliense TaxID=2079482 RepID=UPI00103007FC|nr:transposase [Corynebacterium neomassiliense]